MALRVRRRQRLQGHQHAVLLRWRLCLLVLTRLITLLAHVAVPAKPVSLFFLDLPLNMLLDGSILFTAFPPRTDEAVLDGLPSSSADRETAEYDVAMFCNDCRRYDEDRKCMGSKFDN